MEKKIMSHTDLVLELQQELEEDTSLLEGITVKKRVVGKHALREVCITVDNEEGERTLGKPRGTYITLEGTELADNDGGFHREMSRLLADNLQRLLGEKRKIFFAGLGNARVTPDALGPLVIQNLLITRHLGELSYFARMRSSMALAPGVMAQTGMETGEILKGIIEKSRPEALVLIDALAAKRADRLNRTIQLCDTGIAPGSGVGNRRQEISAVTMGIPVIAIGVPTVISIPAIAGEVLESIIHGLGDTNLEEQFASWSEKEKYRCMAETMPAELFSLCVTPKEIDEAVKRISYTISEGINQVIEEKKEE